MKSLIIGTLASLVLALPIGWNTATAQTTIWVRGYPQLAANGCVEYVAQWSDGTYTWVPWDCPPGVTATMDGLTANRGYPQLAENGCVEYVIHWSDGSYAWVPFSCPNGVDYTKPGAEMPVAGKTITAQAGQQFAIRLESNRTTGFSWNLTLAPDPIIVRLVGSDYEPASPGSIGGGGHEIFTFEAVGAGQTTLTLEYRRPWETDVAPAKTETYTIVIH